MVMKKKASCLSSLSKQKSIWKTNRMAQLFLLLFNFPFSEHYQYLQSFQSPGFTWMRLHKAFGEKTSSVKSGLQPLCCRLVRNWTIYSNCPVFSRCSVSVTIIDSSLPIMCISLHHLGLVQKTVRADRSLVEGLKYSWTEDLGAVSSFSYSARNVS